MKRTLPFLLTLLLMGTLCSCESATTLPYAIRPDSTTVVKTGDRALFVLNEGSGSNTSSIDAIIFRSEPVPDTIRVRNIVTRLGEANDICIVGNQAYVVDNGNNQLLVLNADSLKQSAAITMGTNGPDKVIQITPDELLVTQRASAYAAIVSTTSNSVVDSMQVGIANAAAGTLDGNVWVSTSRYQKPGVITCYRISNKQQQTTIPLVSSPEQVFVDSAHNQIVVACSGDYSTVPPVIYFIDGTTFAIRDSIIVRVPGSLTNAILGNRLYLIEGSTIEAVDLGSYAKTTWISNAPYPYYNGAYDEINHQLYLGRSDYTSETMVDVYDAASATLRWSFPAGIAPAHFAFYR